MAFPLKTKTCPICGTEFTTQFPVQIYCSKLCRMRAGHQHSKEYAERMKEHHARQRQKAIEDFHARRNECLEKNCVWKTPGQRICVMPRCMKKALAEMEEDNNVV